MKKYTECSLDQHGKRGMECIRKELHENDCCDIEGEWLYRCDLIPFDLMR